uniref:Uncharacterized protein n=1 Tax=Chromera velia CCMP2878 TaxID=1169474 RepID=A0A0G4F338_9ALVE|eukprot:Cvel_15002.t1-p1 / transcript=Cvel_15002.t1 / gene=Cvel_15002 / organism=Chromera_velia_CCMP2878 / gene_product=hypothetical protein / transcript_product=hypothetical protein / location=Cvel_scaffold1091:46069-46978(+) / protein_length=238 / sequence_SO=supercontig / SO=protein_coding / is_pseudo=false
MRRIATALSRRASGHSLPSAVTVSSLLQRTSAYSSEQNERQRGMPSIMNGRWGARATTRQTSCHSLAPEIRRPSITRHLECSTNRVPLKTRGEGGLRNQSPPLPDSRLSPFAPLFSYRAAEGRSLHVPRIQSVYALLHAHRQAQSPPAVLLRKLFVGRTQSAHMGGEDTSVKIVGGREYASMGVSAITARTAGGRKFACTDFSALFVKNAEEAAFASTDADVIIAETVGGSPFASTGV